jgi:hypothetical protein
MEAKKELSDLLRRDGHPKEGKSVKDNQPALIGPRPFQQPSVNSQ